MTATPARRHVPDEVSVVEVYGSKFLLEWLEWEVLASAAALHRGRAAHLPTESSPSARRAAA
jgi:hypothetical protein